MEVELDQLKVSKEETCNSEHPAIKLSQSDPTELSKDTLIGWPSQRYLALGQVFHSVCTYDTVSSLNNKDYTIKFLEVHGMVATNEFSGDMIINDQSDCVGLHHGMMSYLVIRQDLKSFLAKDKVVSTTSKYVTKGSLKLVLTNFLLFSV